MASIIKILDKTYFGPDVFGRINQETSHTNIDQFVKVISNRLTNISRPSVQVCQAIKPTVVCVVKIVVVVNISLNKKKNRPLFPYLMGNIFAVKTYHSLKDTVLSV